MYDLRDKPNEMGMEELDHSSSYRCVGLSIYAVVEDVTGSAFQAADYQYDNFDEPESTNPINFPIASRWNIPIPFICNVSAVTPTSVKRS